MCTELQVGSHNMTDRDSPCSGCVVGQECRAVALPSEAVSGLVVAGHHWLGLSLGFTLLWHGPVPLTPSLLQPASSQTPFLQVDPAQLVVYGWVVEKVQRQQHHDKEAVDPHTNQGCIITAGDRRRVLAQCNLRETMINTPHILWATIQKPLSWVFNSQ